MKELCLKNGGYTMIELSLMIGLLVILAVSAIPMFINVGETKADSAAKKLVSDLTYARQLAKNYNGIYGITFDTAAETYTVHSYDSSTSTSTTVTDPHTRTDMVVDFSEIPFLAGVNIQSASFGGTTTVRFNFMGTPENGNEVALATAGSVVFEEGGATRTVAVQPNTGEVSQQ